MHWLHSVPGDIELILARDLHVPAERAVVFARVRSGALVRLVRGAYIASEDWRSLGRHSRYRATIEAVAAMHGAQQLIFSHQSAAAMWRLPSLGRWPDLVHVLSPRELGTRSTTVLRRHSEEFPPTTVLLDGLNVTTLERTAADLSASCRFEQAVVFVDAALHRSDYPLGGMPRTTVDKMSIERELERREIRQGTAKARAVLDFADGRADRPGESISRVSMLRAGIPSPELQVPLRGRSGKSYIVDFWWEQFSLIGEFDGRAKYADPEFLRGRTPEQALLDEKFREDDLRAVGHGMSRWGWELAISPLRLRAHLTAAGIH